MNRDLASRIAVIVAGVLIILGIVFVSKIFYRGMFTGIALACFAMVVFYWITRRVRSK
jgi:hypothetical protein